MQLNELAAFETFAGRHPLAWEQIASAPAYDLCEMLMVFREVAERGGWMLELASCANELPC